MLYKRYIPCIYLYHAHAVRSLNDTSVVDTDPVRLASYFNEHNADELIVFDMSSGDEEHEEALNLIEEICDTVAVPVIGGGHVHRMEDVKKLLYAGCRRAVLDFENPENVEIIQEVSLKFGKEKLLVSFKNPEILTEEQKELIENYAAELLLMNTHVIRETQALFSLPVIVQVNQIALNKLFEIFSYENVSGVTGNIMNDNADEIQTLKKLCQENGIPVAVLEQSMNGKTSGHYQYVKKLTADCDLDTILARVNQTGAACHTGNHSCFFQEIMTRDGGGTANPRTVLEEVSAVIHDRKQHPKEGSYTNYLFDKGIDKILKKLGEEATEIVIAAKNPNPHEIKYEISDFLYHMMVLMEEKGITWDEITEELAKR